MAVRGLKMIYVGLKDDAGQVISGDTGLSATGVYEIDVDRSKGNLGSRTANITGLTGTISKIPGNDQIVDMTKPDAAPSVAIDSNAIDGKVKQMLLGREQSASGAWVEKDGITESALIIETHDVVTNKSVFFAFGRGSMSEASQNVQTDTDTQQTREDDNLTFTALGYKPWNGKAFATYYEGDEGFTRKKMFDEVFPDNTYQADGTTSGGASHTPNPGSGQQGSGSSTHS